MNNFDMNSFIIILIVFRLDSYLFVLIEQVRFISEIPHHFVDSLIKL